MRRRGGAATAGLVPEGPWALALWEAGSGPFASLSLALLLLAVAADRRRLLRLLPKGRLLRAALAAVIVGGLAARAAWSPRAHLVSYDEAEGLDISRNLLEGEGFYLCAARHSGSCLDRRLPTWPPLHPLLVALASSALGRSEAVASLLTLAMSSLVPLAAFLLAREVAGPWPALAAAAAAAFHPVAVRFSATAYSGAASAPLVALAAWALARDRRAPGRFSGSILAAALVAAALARPENAALALVLLAPEGLGGPGARSRPLLALAVAAALPFLLQPAAGKALALSEPGLSAPGGAEGSDALLSSAWFAAAPSNGGPLALLALAGLGSLLSGQGMRRAAPLALVPALLLATLAAYSVEGRRFPLSTDHGRFLLPLVPFVAALSAAGAAALWRALRLGEAEGALAACALSLLCLLAARGGVAPDLGLVGEEQAFLRGQVGAVPEGCTVVAPHPAAASVALGRDAVPLTRALEGLGPGEGCLVYLRGAPCTLSPADSARCRAVESSFGLAPLAVSPSGRVGLYALDARPSH